MTETGAMPEFTISPMTPECFEEAKRVMDLSFGNDSDPDDNDVEQGIIDYDRYLVARDGADIVGTLGAHDLQMTVPGPAVTQVAGFTFGGVHPAYRRRGLMTLLMTQLHRQRYEAGEHTSLLFASEGAVYQRFGYGPAAWRTHVQVPCGAPFSESVATSRVRLVEPDAHTLAGIYDRVRAETPGWVARSAPWWDFRLYDPPHQRAGSALRCALTADGDGYALYSTVAGWHGQMPAGEVHVKELVAASPLAHQSLWRFLLDTDLMVTVAAKVAVDDPLLHLLAEPRSASPEVNDGGWMRPLEVGASLAARRYAHAVDTVLEVVDAGCPWNEGVWRLSGDESGATCERTSAPAELTVDVRDLGAVYLGGPTLASRAGLGRTVERRRGSLRAVSTAFGALGAGPSMPMVL